MDASDWELTMLRSFQFITCTLWDEKQRNEKSKSILRSWEVTGRFHDPLEVHEAWEGYRGLSSLLSPQFRSWAGSSFTIEDVRLHVITIVKERCCTEKKSLQPLLSKRGYKTVWSRLFKVSVFLLHTCSRFWAHFWTHLAAPVRQVLFENAFGIIGRSFWIRFVWEPWYRSDKGHFLCALTFAWAR